MTKSGSEHHQKLINPLLDRLTQICIVCHWWSHQPSSGIHQIISNCSDLPCKRLYCSL